MPTKSRINLPREGQWDGRLSMSRITKERIESILGSAPMPAAVWELQFDGNNEDLRRIAYCDWEDVREQDLRSYIHDLAYVKLQPDLFRHAFPFCLSA
jgi:hypothetical protein